MDIKKAAILGLGAAAATIPVMGYAFSLPFCIRSERAVFKNLPNHLRGLKILHIADFHGRFTHKKHINIWPYLHGLKFDMAVFTGDVILDSPDQLHPHADDLKALAERVPTFYVDGNHERRCSYNVAKMLEDMGITVLFNQHGNFVVGEKGQANSPVVPITGFREYGYLSRRDFTDVEPLIDHMAKESFCIILCHQPQIFDLLDKRIKSGLVLAGHTHGGQLRLPFMPTLYAPGQGILPKYGDGWYEKDGLKMFISRGVGATHFFIRTFNPPEVAIIELQRA